MIEIFKLFMDKPLNGIVAVLCVVTLAIHLGLADVRLAQATLVEQQRSNDKTTKLVLEMHETLIRIDENVKQLKEKNRNAN